MLGFETKGLDRRCEMPVLGVLPLRAQRDMYIFRGDQQPLMCRVDVVRYLLPSSTQKIIFRPGVSPVVRPASSFSRLLFFVPILPCMYDIL